MPFCHVGGGGRIEKCRYIVAILTNPFVDNNYCEIVQQVERFMKELDRLKRSARLHTLPPAYILWGNLEYNTARNHTTHLSSCKIELRIERTLLLQNRNDCMMGYRLGLTFDKK